MKLFGAGGFIGTMIALAAVGLSYVELHLEEQRSRTTILAELLRDDPAQTAHLILQADEMGVVSLSVEERMRALAVIDREMRAVAAAAEAGAPSVSAAPPPSNPQALAAALDSPDWAARVGAAQAISARRRADRDVTESMIEMLETRWAEVSATGLHSLVFLLDRQQPASWTDELRRRCVDVLEDVDTREELDPATRQLADDLSDRLAAALEVS